MDFHEIPRALSQGEIYSAELVSNILHIRNSETNSEYIIESFGQSIQIRQAVWFNCLEMSTDVLNNLYKLCSMLNERFSGCKSYIDKWGTLITAADIISESLTKNFLEILLGQIEFISQATLSLIELSQENRNVVTHDEIDSVLNVPSLQ